VDLVPVPGVLLDRLAALGVDVDQVLRVANVSRSRFREPKARLDTSEFFALWGALERVTAGRDLGLRLGASPLPHQYDVVSMAALHALSVGDALRKLARYKRLVCPEQVTLEITQGEARVKFEWLLATGNAPDFLIDATFSSTLALARRGTNQPIKARRVELTRPARDEALLARYFDCELRFGAPRDLLVFDEAALAIPFVTYNLDLLGIMVPQLDSALEQQSRQRSVLDEVRLALSRSMSGERPSVDKIAKDLGMSGRTLQRKLESLGATYQGVLDEVRQKSACHLLSKTDIDPEEVAFLLGFEELNSFTRAFQAWEGTTPKQWRGAERARH
jgi:AraC-like DNA-binding protein